LDGRAPHRQPDQQFVKEQRVNRIRTTRPLGWDQAPGWGQPFPGWSPLVDPNPLPLQAARSLSRWWWPTLAVAGFLAVVTLVLGREDRAAGLSGRGLLTIVVAAAVVILLTIHRRSGPRPLARALAEYATVALLAALLAASAASGVDKQAANHAAGGQAKASAQARADASHDQPAVLQAVTKVLRAGAKVVRAVTGAAGWLVNLWRQADQQARPKGETTAAPPPSPTPPASWTWRSRP
jgi:hypothetical protein